MWPPTTAHVATVAASAVAIAVAFGWTAAPNGQAAPRGVLAWLCGGSERTSEQCGNAGDGDGEGERVAMATTATQAKRVLPTVLVLGDSLTERGYEDGG
jgi:hypothetical protein